MATCRCALVHMTGSGHRSTPSTHNFFKLPFSSSSVPLLTTLQQNVPLPQIDAPFKRIGEASVKLLDAFVDLTFEFVDEPRLPSQSNFAPVEERGEPVQVSTVEGEIPGDFPEGIYIRNGANPLYGGQKSAVSIFGKTSSLWVEGEGMLHAVYFKKDRAGNWETTYNNRYVETETYLLEKARNKPCILPAAEGDPSAVILSFMLNSLRSGMANKLYSNTNVIEHAGRFFSTAENHIPQEIDIQTLGTLENWTVDGAWTRPSFTSHPKKAPGTGELVIMGIDSKKPYYEVGVISADGTQLVHKADIKFDRSVLSHDIGVTQRYNVILDFPVIVDVVNVLKGGSLIKYDKYKYSRIGVMPRYGNGDSVKWFSVQPGCAFHLFNCYEDGDEVVVMGCQAKESIVPGPELGINKYEWFSRGLKNVYSAEQNDEDITDQDGKLFARAYEWRLNMETGGVKEGYLTGTDFAIDFPMINPQLTGLKTKYGYAQVVDSTASSTAGMVKYGGLAKLHLEERDAEVSMDKRKGEELTRVEYHMFPANTYCTGAAFVPKSGGADEDDGWIIAFVHDEDTDTSQAYIVDAKHISAEAVAKIAMPNRVPYGFHGMFASTG